MAGDLTAPRLRIAAGQKQLGQGETTTITFTFTETVTGFTLADVTATGGALTGLATADNITFTATLTTATGFAGIGRISVDSRGFADLAGNAGAPLALFRANDGSTGVELWATDGTAAGTRLLRDIDPGAGDSAATGFLALGDGRSAFTARTSVTGQEIWVTDGTAAGTTLVVDLAAGNASGASGHAFVSLGNGTFLFGYRDPVLGVEPGISDGTAAGTRLIKDLDPSGSGLSTTGAQLQPGKVIFVGEDGGSGNEPFVTDGTAAGTFRLADIYPGTRGSDPYSLTALGDGRLLFLADEPGSPGTLWITDGTVAGTARVAGFGPDSTTNADNNILLLGPGRAVFAAAGAQVPDPLGGGGTVASGIELWITDGTAAGTRLLKDIAPGAEESFPRLFTRLGNGLAVFNAGNALGDEELWVTDGTTAGTTLLRDIYPGIPSSDPRILGVLGDGRAVFSAADVIHGREVWVTDGTSAGTTLLGDINPGAANGLDMAFVGGLLGDGRVLFRAASSTGDAEPWVTDGTPAGTLRLFDIAPGVAGSQPFGFTPVAPDISFTVAPRETVAPTLAITTSDRVLSIGETATITFTFSEQVTGFGAEDITLRGGWLGALATADHITFTATFTPDAGFQDVASIVVNPAGYTDLAGNAGTAPRLALFSARTAAEGRELFGTDFTDAGTAMLFASAPGTQDGNPRTLFDFGDGRVGFIGSAPTGGGSKDVLFVTNGSMQGTINLRDVTVSGAIASVETSARLPDGTVLFGAVGAGARGNTLWATDGTAAGTKEVLALSEVNFLTVLSSGQVVFRAATVTSELWTTNGTAAGTHLLKDLNGASGGNPANITALGDGRALFIAGDIGTGRELWVTDGTEAGTSLVLDLATGTATGAVDRSFYDFLNPSTSGYPVIVPFGTGRAFFIAGDDVPGGREPWITDGTAAGTHALGDLLPGGNSDPTNFIDLGDGRALFSAVADGGLRCLWLTDGTEAGTALLAGPEGALVEPTYTTAFGSGHALFTARVSDSEYGTWITDGTTAGTYRLTSIGSVSGINSAYADMGNGFALFTATSAAAGSETWITDGTPDGTRLLHDNDPGLAGSNPRAYFAFQSAQRQDFNIDTLAPTPLITTDDAFLTAGQTARLTFTFPEPVMDFTLADLSIAGGRLVGGLSNSGNNVYTTFVQPLANTDNTPITITLAAGGVTDLAGNAGTQASFTLTGDTVAPTFAISTSDTVLRAGETATITFAFSEKVLGFAAADIRTAGGTLGALATADGGQTYTASFTPTAGVSRPGGVSVDTASITDLAGNALGQAALFGANDGSNGVELWRTDGSGAGTRLISDINPGAADSTPMSFTPLGDGRIVFRAGTATTGSELWVSDGTAAGITLLSDINPGSAGAVPQNLVALADGRILFNADDGVHGRELWVTDGSTAGTQLLADINPAGGGVAATGGAVPLGDGRVLFLVDDGSTGFEPWVSDGTTGGTRLLADLSPGGVSSGASGFTALGDGRALFTADDGVAGTELTITDGSTAGTRLVADIAPGSAAGVLTASAAITAIGGGRAIFTAADGEPWITDGSTAGTQLLRDIAASGGSNAAGFRVLGNGLIVFAADDGVAGNELWVSDGTAAGTRLITINSGAGASLAPGVQFGLLADGRAVFGADQGFSQGAELYVTDGTMGLLLASINPGTASSNPQGFTALGDGRVLFSAITASGGREVWITDGTGLGTRRVADINPGAAGSDPLDFIALPAGLRFSIDTVRPGLAGPIAISDTALKIGDTALVTFTFNDVVTGFTTADLTAPGGVLSGLASTDGITWTATLTPAAGLTAATTAIALDLAGIANTGGTAGLGTVTSGNYAVDTEQPTALSIGLSDNALKIGETAGVTFTFSEAVTGLTTADVTVPNGMLSGLVAADGGLTWTATLTPDAGASAAANTLSLDLAGIADLAGNAGTGRFDSSAYGVDTLRPGLAAPVALSDTALSIGDTALVSFTFTEKVSGFTTADVTVPGGTLSDLASLNGGLSWTATLTPRTGFEAAGNTLSLDLTGIADLAGNAGSGTGASVSYAVDTLRPTLVGAIALNDTALKIGDAALVTFTFSEKVTGFTTADVTVANATLSGLATSDGGTNYTATLTPLAGRSAAANSLSLDLAGLADLAGNAGSGSAPSPGYAVDTQAPAIGIGSPASLLAPGAVASVSFTFSEAVAGFTAADVSALGGAISGFAATANPLVYTASFTRDSGPAASLAVDAGSYTDLAGNAGGAGALGFDATLPSLSITTDRTALKQGLTAALTFTFSEAVTGFTTADITASGGSVANIAATADPLVYTATFTPSADTETATAGVAVTANSYTGLGGAPGGGGSLALAVDTRPPVALIVSSDASLILGDVATLSFSFSEPVTGFAADDISTTRGRIGTLTTSDSITFQASFTPDVGFDGSATASIALRAGAVSDAAGNSNIRASLELPLDTLAPSPVAISFTNGDTSLTIGETATVQIGFAEPVTNVTLADLTARGGSLSGFAVSGGSGQFYTAFFTPDVGVEDADAGIGVLAGGYGDMAGNAGLAGRFSFAVDTTAPRLTITADDTALRLGETALLTFTFSEPVVGFDTADIIATGGAVSGLAMTAAPGTFTATFTPSANTQNPAGGVRVLAASHIDAAGNAGAATSLALAVDTQRPGLAGATGISDTALIIGETALVTFSFTEAVTGFTAADVTVPNGTLGGLGTSDGITYTAVLTPAPGQTAAGNSLTLDLAGIADLAGNAGSGSAASGPYAVDTLAPTLVIASPAGLLLPGEIATLTFTFSEAVAGFTAEDVLASGGSISGLTATGPGSVTAIFTRGEGAVASLGVAAGSYTDLALNPGGDAGLGFGVDLTPPMLGIATDDATLRRGEAATLTFTFSEPVLGFTLDDISASGGTVSNLEATADPRVYTGRFAPDAMTENALAGVSVARATYMDQSGNAGGAASLALAVDTRSPSLVITSSDLDGVVNAAETPTIRFTFSEAVTGFGAEDITLSGGSLGALATSDSIVFQARFTPVANGLGRAGIAVTEGDYLDQAGNAGGAGALGFDLDGQAPGAATVLRLADTGAHTFILSGGAEAGAQVVLRAGGTTLGLGTADGAGQFGIAFGARLGDGSYQLALQASDAAGNASAAGPLLRLVLRGADLGLSADQALPGFALVTGPGDDVVELTGDGLLLDLGAGKNQAALSGQSAQLHLGADDDTVIGFASLAHVEAGGGGNSIILMGSHNRVTAGDGANLVKNNLGFAEITLGGGDNTVQVWGTGNLVTLGGGRNLVESLDGGLRLRAGHGDNIVGLHRLADDITLGDGANTVVIAGGGAATIRLGAGDNAVNALAAAIGNTITAGDGQNDLVLGGIGNVVSTGGGADYVLAALGGLRAVTGAGRDTVLLGASVASRVEAGEGGDILYSSGAADQLDGGLGDDAYVLRGTAATVIEAEGGGHDTVWAGVNGIAAAAHIEIYRLFEAADVFTGGAAGETIVANQALASTLDGGAGDDQLFGSALADVLRGGAGDDVLRGGGGADHYVYDNPSWGHDVIGGWQAGQLLDFRGTGLRLADLAVTAGDGFTLVTLGGSSLQIYGAAHLVVGDFLF